MGQQLRKPTPPDVSSKSTIELTTKEPAVNLSHTTGSELRHFAMSERWKIESTNTLPVSNDWIDTHGLPLDRGKQF